MRVVFILIKVTRRDKEVKRRLKCLLGIVEERLPAIPARGAKGAWRVNQASKCLRHIFILRIFETPFDFFIPSRDLDKDKYNTHRMKSCFTPRDQPPISELGHENDMYPRYPSVQT